MDESPAVIFFALTNSSAAQINVTLRATDGEDAISFYRRTLAFIASIDPSSPTDFRLTEVKRMSGSQQKKKDFVVAGDLIHVKSLSKVIRPNAQKPNEPWLIMRVTGVDSSGQEVFADAFYGSASYQKAGNIVASNPLFSNFTAWSVGDEHAIPPERPLVAKVVKGKYGYDVTEFRA